MYFFHLTALLVHMCGAFGITAGAHRLWAHKSYKAKLPLRIILTIMQTISFQVRSLNYICQDSY